jgi:hypothetical protein
MMRNKLYVLLAVLVLTAIATANAGSSSKKSEKQKAASKDDEEDLDYDIEVDSSETSPLDILRSMFGLSGKEATPIPSPTYPFINNPTIVSGFSCNSLIDLQYPIFSDMCGAVPQARYSLPNTFGHNDRWQIAHILSTLMAPITDPVCISSLRHLLCPILFQPCRARHEPALVLPCQHYCRAVKSQCGVSALDVIPCEALPYASDYCPNIQQQPSLVPSSTGFLQSQPQASATILAPNNSAARSIVPPPPKPAAQSSSVPENAPKTQQVVANNDQNRATASADGSPAQKKPMEYHIPTQYIPPGYPNVRYANGHNIYVANPAQYVVPSNPQIKTA